MNLDENEDDSEEIELQSSKYFPPMISDDEESSRRTSSSLNNYSILPPIKSTLDDHSPQPQQLIKQLQEKYQQPNGSTLFFIDNLYVLIFRCSRTQ